VARPTMRKPMTLGIDLQVEGHFRMKLSTACSRGSDRRFGAFPFRWGAMEAATHGLRRSVQE